MLAMTRVLRGKHEEGSAQLWYAIQPHQRVNKFSGESKKKIFRCGQLIIVKSQTVCVV